MWYMQRSTHHLSWSLDDTLIQIYFCKVQEDPERKELVYFERELVEDPVLEELNRKKRTES